MIELVVRADPAGRSFTPIEVRVGRAARRCGIVGACVGVPVLPVSQNFWDILGRSPTPASSPPVLARVYVRQVA